MFYCPYVPLQMVRAVGEHTFQPKIGFQDKLWYLYLTHSTQEQLFASSEGAFQSLQTPTNTKKG